MSNSNLVKLLVIFIVGVFCYIFWRTLSEKYFNVEYPVDITYEKVEIVFTPEQMKEILLNE